jgi:TraY domain
MAYRKSLIQTKFRLRQDLLRKLEREAKRHDRSTTNEVAQRLEDSFRYEKERGQMAEERQRMAEERQRLAGERERMAEERQALFMAMLGDLRSHPDPAATKAALATMEESAERYVQAEVMEEIFPTEGRKP